MRVKRAEKRSLPMPHVFGPPSPHERPRLAAASSRTSAGAPESVVLGKYSPFQWSAGTLVRQGLALCCIGKLRASPNQLTSSRTIWTPSTAGPLAGAVTLKANSAVPAGGTA